MSQELMAACIGGDVEKVKELLTESNANWCDEKGSNILIRMSDLTALTQNHLEIVDLLIAKKANVNFQEAESQKAALHLAASKKHIPLIETLVANKADLEIRDKIGSTPLICCARFENADAVIHKLIALGADITAANNISTETTACLNALHIAIIYNRLENVDALLALGADPTKTNFIGESPISLAKKNSEIVQALQKAIKNFKPKTGHLTKYLNSLNPLASFIHDNNVLNPDGIKQLMTSNQMSKSQIEEGLKTAIRKKNTFAIIAICEFYPHIFAEKLCRTQFKKNEAEKKLLKNLLETGALTPPQLENFYAFYGSGKYGEEPEFNRNTGNFADKATAIMDHQYYLDRKSHVPVLEDTLEQETKRVEGEIKNKEDECDILEATLKRLNI